MHTSKLLQILKTLTKTEERLLRLFVQSPYYNQREDVEQLCYYLLKNSEKPSISPVFQKEKVWKALNHPKLYDDKSMRYTMSYLLDLVEKFLIEQEYQKDLFSQNKLLITSLKNRGLDKIAEAVPLQNQVEELDFNLKTIIEIMHEGCLWLEKQKTGDTLPSFPLLDACVDILETNPELLQNGTLQVNYQAFRMLQNGENGGENHFYLLKEALLKNSTPLPIKSIESMSIIWLMAINFAIKKQNQGNRIYAKEALILYLSGLKQGILLENGHISKKTYSNILVLYILSGELQIAEEFLTEYKHQLPERERENTYLHNLATLHFKKRDFKQVLITLQDMQFTDALHNMEARRLLLCSYYELGEMSAFESLLDSFGIWLRRSKNLGYHRDLYANLIKIARKLLDLKYQDKSYKTKLLKEIEETKLLAGRDWLVDWVTG
jgi:hypothetical protein